MTIELEEVDAVRVRVFVKKELIGSFVKECCGRYIYLPELGCLLRPTYQECYEAVMGAVHLCGLVPGGGDGYQILV